MPKKINNSILEKKWPRNESYVEDNPYEAPTFTYNNEMDQLVETNTITNEVEDEDSIACADARMTKLDDEEESMMPEPWSLEKKMTIEEEENPKLVTLKIEMGSNDVSNTPREVGSTQYVHHRERWYQWFLEEVVA